MSPFEVKDLKLTGTFAKYSEFVVQVFPIWCTFAINLVFIKLAKFVFHGLVGCEAGFLNAYVLRVVMLPILK